METDRSVFKYKIGPLSPLHSGSYTCESDGLNIKQIFNVAVDSNPSATTSTEPIDAGITTPSTSVTAIVDGTRLSDG